MEICGIYKITSPTGKVYIGQSTDVINRIKYHKGLYSKDSPKLYNSLKKHGVENHLFEIIEECSLYKLNDRERYWQEHYDVLSEHGLNCVYTNSSDKSGRHSDKTREKISKALTGRKLSKEQIEKNRARMIGVKQSKETIEKRASKMRGRKMKPEQIIFLKTSRLKSNNPMYGKRHTAASILKISEGLKGANNYLYKPIFNPSTGIYYDTLEEAGFSIGFDKRKLWAHMNIYVNNKTPFIYA